MRATLVVLCAAASPAAAMRMASPVARARAAARDASYADSRFRDGDYGMPMHRGRAMRPARQSSYPYQVQGDSLRTWSGAGHPSEYSEVWMESDGRPIEADVELWQGPGYTPRKMRVYSQDGQIRPFRTGMHNAGGRAFAVRNRGPIEFPLAANVAGGMPTYNGQPESPYAYDHRQSRQQQHQGWVRDATTEKSSWLSFSSVNSFLENQSIGRISPFVSNELRGARTTRCTKC